MDEGWWQEGGGIEGKEEGKGREILVKMEEIRGGVLVRTNAQKSSKIYHFIQNLPPLQNGKCCQSAPDNCDYMVKLTLCPLYPIEMQGYKSIPIIPI